MDSRKWQKIEEAIAAAPEISGARRGAWLEEFCAGDAELKAEIESLLACLNEAENFLEKSVSPYAAQILPENGNNFAGKQFGNYKIVAEIGRGGMGAVFLAERTDGEFNQQVALKIVRQTILDAESEKRFRRERQILASLNHPNIARLLDGGVSEMGEPFLAMEFIKGELLAEFVENHDLNLEERLNLFLKVCSAASYAHRNLIVHRDIKPSNILVTKDGESKLLDFGLAKILDESRLEQTQTEFRALTPAYASPEQTRGELVTTASDIYSLGAVLYELIHKEKFRNRQTKNGKRKTNAEIEAILLTALDDEPERRYKSVEAFAEDIERFLNKKPIKARPATFAYRAAKFVKRNKFSVAAATLILLTLFGGIVATLWQSRIARQERAKADLEKTKAQTVSSFLTQTLNYSDPNNTLKHEMTVKEILDKAADKLENEIFAAQPEVKAELDSIIGFSYYSQGLYESAEKHFRIALQEQIKLYGADSLQVLKTKTLLAAVVLGLSRNSEAQQIYREILPRLRFEYRNGAVEADYLATGIHDYAVLRRAQGDSKEAEDLLREAVVLIPFFTFDNKDYTANIIRGSLALTLFDQGKLDESLAMSREHISELRKTTSTNSFYFAYALTGVGSRLVEKGEFEEAETTLTEAEGVYRKLLGDWHLALGDNLRNQAECLYKQGKLEKAQSKIAETLKIYRANTGVQYINYPTALTIEGLILNKMGKFVEAEKILREAVKIREENLPKEHFLTALAKSALGECLTTQKRFREAEPLLSESYETLRQSQGEQNPRTLLAKNRLHKIYEMRNNSE